MTNKNILIVDDDPATLAMLRKYLSTAGYDVFSATNGKEALDLLRVNEIQLIVSDWVMPIMDGIELCQTIREFEAIGFIYIILLAAHSDKERVVEAFEAGADDYLSKPFHKGELLARVNAGCRIIELEADLERKNREIHKVNAEMAILNRKLEEIATTDELTGLANRREAMNQLTSAWASSERHDHPLSVIMIDLDKFKNVNDTYGHSAGDVVLQNTARTIKKHTRSGDTVCRIGGEEVLVICPHADEDQAIALAERLREAVASDIIKCDDLEICVTISAGVAEKCRSMSTPDHLLARADDALYAAKEGGRNKVCTVKTDKSEQDIKFKTPDTRQKT